MLVLARGALLRVSLVARAFACGAALERYAPEHDGGSILVKNFDADGRLISTESQNLAIIPDLRAFTESGQAISDELEKVYGSPQDMEDAEVVEVRRRTLEASGRISDATDTLVLDPRGLLLLASRERRRRYRGRLRPARRVAARPISDPGSVGAREGKAGPVNYELERPGRRLRRLRERSGRLRRLPLRADAAGLLQSGTERYRDFEDTYCAGVGLVESKEFDGAGKLTRAQHGRRRPTRRRAEHAASVTPGPPHPQRGGGRGPCVVASRPTSGVSGRRASRRRAPSPRPTCRRTRPCCSRRRRRATSSPSMRERILAAYAGGSILTAPSTGRRPSTRETGRIYFGATDKKLYALDARGLFLWAFETGDNVASRPVVAGDTVVFGGENRYVYGLDAGTGEERWSGEAREGRSFPRRRSRAGW